MNKLKNITKTNKAITLVALVITVVVMLIIVTVSINMLIGQDGIITKSQEAKEKYQKAQDYENKTSSEINNVIDAFASTRNTEIDNLLERLKVIEEKLESYEEIDGRLSSLENTNDNYRAGTVSFGVIAASAQPSKTITFSKALENANYTVVAVLTSRVTGFSYIVPVIETKTTTGFTITACNNSNAATGNISFNWLAIPYK